MTARNEVVKRCKALGAALEFSRVGQTVELRITAPDQHVWSCTGDAHELVISGSVGPWGVSGFLYDAILIDVRDGVEPCTDAACEWCGRDTAAEVTK